VINNFYKEEPHAHAARVTSVGGWLSLKREKIIEPPEIPAECFGSLSRRQKIFED
jgi:hypothetical protein